MTRKRLLFSSFLDQLAKDGRGRTEKIHAHVWVRMNNSITEVFHLTWRYNSFAASSVESFGHVTSVNCPLSVALFRLSWDGCKFSFVVIHVASFWLVCLHNPLCMATSGSQSGRCPASPTRSSLAFPCRRRFPSHLSRQFYCCVVCFNDFVCIAQGKCRTCCKHRVQPFLRFSKESSYVLEQLWTRNH